MKDVIDHSIHCAEANKIYYSFKNVIKMLNNLNYRFIEQIDRTDFIFTFWKIRYNRLIFCQVFYDWPWTSDSSGIIMGCLHEHDQNI